MKKPFAHLGRRSLLTPAQLDERPGHVASGERLAFNTGILVLAGVAVVWLCVGMDPMAVGAALSLYCTTTGLFRRFPARCHGSPHSPPPRTWATA